MLFGGKLLTDAKNSNFEIFESALYIKSGSMSLGGILETRPLNMGTTIVVRKVVLNLGKLIGPKKFTYIYKLQ